MESQPVLCDAVKTKTKIESYGSSNELAEKVHEKWFNFVAGDYTLPPIPSLLQFKSLIEVAYLATMEMEETRPTVFTLCCGRKGKYVKTDYQNEIIEHWPFETERSFNIQEIRRLSVATDSDSTAIWVHFPKRIDAPLEIRGLLNLGPSWATARNAYSYFYKPPPKTVTVRGLAPGHLVIYQGNFAIGQIKSGVTQVGDLPYAFMDLLGAYPIFQAGHKSLREALVVPKREYVKDWHEFEWMAYVNVLLAIVNSINIQGHGGTLIVSNPNFDIHENELFKAKYLLSPHKQYLKLAFINFMNMRHKHSDKVISLNQHGKTSNKNSQLYVSFFKLIEAEKNLAESCIFVGKLSGVDGAIFITSNLELQGFGTEIRLDKIPSNTKVYKVRQYTENNNEELDSEQFGMRHRSAIKLCSICEDVVVFVISQDGNISLVWNKESKVYFKSDIKTTNLNMILS